MNTDLDDWEQMDIETLTLPTLVLQKKMEERKLVEESDHILTNELFGLEQTHDQIPAITSNTITEKATIPTKTSKLTKSCQKINEEKQKEKSVKIRQKKAEIQKTREIFGDSSDPNIEYYSSLEDKYS